MENRRDFIKKISLGTAAIAAFPAMAAEFRKWTKIVILHTNDMHSRIEPFPEDHSTYPGLGGMARRAALVKQIRSKEQNVLLLDSGDIFQGTPYFNMYGGALEFELMSQMEYDAATMGNHDFDNGLKGFEKMLPKAKFPFVCSNYNFDKTILKNRTQKYKILQKGGIKIGILGLGVELEGLVDPENYGKTLYQNPVDRANEVAKKLKLNKKCDLVICLSHLGFKYDSDKISDMKLAPLTKNIDLILGGHTHTFLEKGEKMTNLSGQGVIINQVGWAGINLGRIDCYFRKKSLLISDNARSMTVGKNYARC